MFRLNWQCASRDYSVYFESTSLKMKIMRNWNYSIFAQRLLNAKATSIELIFLVYAIHLKQKNECCSILHTCELVLEFPREPSLNICLFVRLLAFIFTVGLISSKSWIAITAARHFNFFLFHSELARQLKSVRMFAHERLMSVRCRCRGVSTEKTNPS